METSPLSTPPEMFDLQDIAKEEDYSVGVLGYKVNHFSFLFSIVTLHCMSSLPYNVAITV